MPGTISGGGKGQAGLPARRLSVVSSFLSHSSSRAGSWAASPPTPAFTASPAPASPGQDGALAGEALGLTEPQAPLALGSD